MKCKGKMYVYECDESKTLENSCTYSEVLRKAA